MKSNDKQALQADAREKGEAVLSEVEGKAIAGVLSNAEYEAGDVDDIAPAIEADEDAYWGWHTYWAVTKLLNATQPAQASEKCKFADCTCDRRHVGEDGLTDLERDYNELQSRYGALFDEAGNLIAAAKATHPQPVTPAVDGESFICYLIDNCEREVIHEESLHEWLADFLKNPRYHKPVTPAGGEVEPVAWAIPLEVECLQEFGGMIHVTGGSEPESDRTLPLYLHPPVADAALPRGHRVDDGKQLAMIRDAARYRWWRENIDLLDQQSMLGIAYSCQIPVHNGHVPTAELMDMIADSQDAALNQRGG